MRRLMIAALALALTACTALLSVRSIDQYQIVDLGCVGALLRDDTIVTVWEVR